MYIEGNEGGGEEKGGRNGQEGRGEEADGCHVAHLPSLPSLSVIRDGEDFFPFFYISPLDSLSFPPRTHSPALVTEGNTVFSISPQYITLLRTYMPYSSSCDSTLHPTATLLIPNPITLLSLFFSSL